MKDHSRMRSYCLAVAVAVIAVVIATGACTQPNPHDCADGTCTDPGLPFCDIEGDLGDTAKTCVAVDCTPGELHLCRGNTAVTCNATGNDFDLIACPLGCDPSIGCRTCTNDTQCAGASPICDAGTNSCRACHSDDECSSRVCDVESGACLHEEMVVYAAPSGVGACSLAHPCSLPQAIMVASTASVTPTLRMLPGTYTDAVDVELATPSPLAIVASGALVSTTTAAVIVKNGGNVSIRGVSIVNSQAVQCGVAGGTPSSLSISNASITATSTNAHVLDLVRCTVQLSASDLSLAASEIAVVVGDDGVFKADRIHMHGNIAHQILASSSKHVSIEITNSLLEDVGFLLSTGDTGPPGSQMTFSEDTFVFVGNNLLSQGCDTTPSANRVVRYENTIVAALGSFDAVVGTNCTFVNTILNRQSAPPAGTLVTDPKFIDSATKDFHLAIGSPAIDAAKLSVFGVDSVHDLDGVARPQGAKPDIGAYERAP